MSKRERTTEKIRDTWLTVYIRQNGKCCRPFCNHPMRQLAHVIGQTKMNIRIYGTELIHHPSNLRGVCGLVHNAAVAINPAAQPLLAEQHVAEVREIMEREEQDGISGTGEN